MCGSAAEGAGRALDLRVEGGEHERLGGAAHGAQVAELSRARHARHARRPHAIEGASEDCPDDQNRAGSLIRGGAN